MMHSLQSEKGRNNLQSSTQQEEKRQNENPGQKQKGSPPREEFKRLSSYALEEFKRIKMTLPLYGLMKVPEIRDTLLGSLNDASTKIISQNVSHLARGVSSVQQSSCEHKTNFVNDESPYASELP